MTPEQEAKLMQDRIQELRFVLKRPPTNEEIQESISRNPINYKNEGVTDLTDIAVNPNRTVPDIGFNEEPGDVRRYEPIQDDLNDEIMNLVQQVDGGEQNGLAQALNATKADDPVTTFSRSPEDLADEGSEVMKFDYLENGYHTITPLPQNVGPSGSLTFGPNDVITAETPDQKRDRINQTRKTVLSDPGFPEKNDTAPKPVSKISDTSTVSQNFDYLSAEGIPPEDVSETKEEVKQKNLAEVMAENFAEVINPDSEKKVVDQAEDPVEMVQKTIAKNEEITKQQEGKEVTDDLVMPEDGVITSVDSVSPESAEIETQVVDGAPAKPLGKTALKTTSSLPQDTEMVQLTDLMNSLSAGDLNKDIIDAVLESPGYDMMFEKGIEKEKVDLINAEITANNKRLSDVASKKIKPFFGEKDTGRKILAAIAAGLGAYASAMTGTKNFALEIINQAIETDLLKQKEQLERERLSILDQNKILESRKAELYTVAQIQIKDAMAKAASEDNKQKLLVTLEGINQRERQARTALGAEIIKVNASRRKELENRTLYGVNPEVNITGTTRFTGPVGRENFKKAQIHNLSASKVETAIDDALRILGANKPSNLKQKVKAVIPRTTERETLREAVALVANEYRQVVLNLGTQFTQFEGNFLQPIIDNNASTFAILFGTLETQLTQIKKRLREKTRDASVTFGFSDPLQQTEPQLDINPGLKTGL
jgi:hypothetical protein